MKSDFSEELFFALGSYPSKPNAPQKSDSLSTSESMYIYWDAVTTDSLDVRGYKLYADTGRRDEMRLVYNGINYPSITNFVYS